MTASHFGAGVGVGLGFGVGVAVGLGFGVGVGVSVAVGSSVDVSVGVMLVLAAKLVVGVAVTWLCAMFVFGVVLAAMLLTHVQKLHENSRPTISTCNHTDLERNHLHARLCGSGRSGGWLPGCG